MSRAQYLVSHGVQNHFFSNAADQSRFQSSAMLIPEGKVALCSFSIYVLLSLFLFFGQQLIGAWGIISASLALVLGWTPTLVVPYTAVSRRAAFLGCVFGFSLHLSLSNTLFVHFGWYLASLSFFHFSEYMMIAIYIPGKLSLDSFLLNHSAEYQIAAAASWFEFLLELWLFPNLKRHSFISCIGLVLMIGGEVIRKLAMITAKSNFSHIVESRKEKGHVLVTQGVYSLCRHPSYVGWFWWSIGTQVTLCNPICLVAYTWASWNFFNERIQEEEVTLLYFFEEDYLDYQKKVGTGLPFIKGFEFKPEMLKDQ